MAACARCGARLLDDDEACRRCGQKPMPPPGATQPLGSPGELSIRAGTLVLGSGVPLSDAQPSGHEPDERTAKPKPLTEPLPPAARGERERRPRRRIPPPALEGPTPDPQPTSTHPRPARRLPARAAVTVALLVVAATLVVLGLARHRRPEMTARARFDERGRPLLELSCPDCADGTEVRLGKQASDFRNGRSVIAAEPPLALGASVTHVDLRSPGAGEFHDAEVPLSVDWVVSVDLTGLSRPSPLVAIVFETGPDVGVIVDGNAVPGPPNAPRRFDIDVSKALTGPGRGVQKLSRRVPYGIRLANGESTRATLEISAEIAPLVVDAPIESITVEGPSFMLAGSTQPEGTVSVEGRPITVDPRGHFAQLMSVSAVGDTTVTVRASAPGRAPRLVPIRVRRVASLANEAEAFAKRATRTYSAIAEDIEGKLGWKVALTGTIAEVETRGQTSSVVLETKEGCGESPCRVHLRLGGRCPFAVGTEVTAFGYLAGKWKEPGSGHIRPEVRVEFLRGDS
jgi:hypothetical protein